MGKVRTITKNIILLALIGAIVVSSDRLMMPKNYVQTTEWIATSNAKGLYDLDQNSVDVLFIGTSHCYSSFSPQELYNKYNITSYNLGTGIQSTLVSYYWLKEVLQYQTPKVVVFEPIMLWGYKGPLNSTEAWVRNAIDPMRWSSVKKEAVDDICRLDPAQSKMSYYLPFIRFHERWKEFNEDDFSEGKLRKHNELKGFSPLLSTCDIEDFQPLTEGSGEEVTGFNPTARDYLDKMVGLCNDNGIPLVIVASPYTKFTIDKHNAAQQYADEHGIRFIDINEENTYNELEYDFAVDNHDMEHPNLSGANKITDYLGKVFTEEYGLTGHVDEQWESTKPAYEDISKDFAAKHEDSLTEYLKLISDPRYTVFISTKGDYTVSLTDDQIQGLRDLGLETNFRNSTGESFCAVIKDGKVAAEKSGPDVIEGSGSEAVGDYGSFRGGKSHYQIMSSVLDDENGGSIVIDDTESSLKLKGINIVVYNTARRQILDKVNFDTCGGSGVSR